MALKIAAVSLLWAFLIASPALLVAGCVRDLRPGCADARAAIDGRMDQIAEAHRQGKIDASQAIGYLALQAIAVRRLTMAGGPCE